MELTEIFIGGIRILEPVTVLTDFIITAVCIYAYFRLRKQAKQNSYMRLYPWFFMFMAISCFCGGLLTHAIPYIFPENIGVWNKMPCWLFNILSTSTFMLCMVERYKALFSDSGRKKLLTAIWCEIAIILCLLFVVKSFLIVEIQIAIAVLLTCVPMQIAILRKVKYKECTYNMIASMVLVITIAVMACKFSISKWFNYNDISHVIITITMFYYYLGAMEMQKEFSKNGEIKLS
ncbi:MAG: hypothetical protein HUK15_06430 [Bacteroidales bacterium]|nr:hypothetical protein [Bacteroidales bacterium]